MKINCRYEHNHGPESRVSPGKISVKNILEVLMVSFRLGLTSFGGPIAHLGYFRHEYVDRRKWLDDRAYADLVALCQVLPGPASSQVGMGIGAMRGGITGAIAAWVGFTLPSMLLLIMFALAVGSFHLESSGLIYSLKIVAVAIVAHAVLGMARSLTPDRNRATIAVFTAGVILLAQSAVVQVALILVAAFAGALMFKNAEGSGGMGINIPVKRWISVLCIILFFGLLILLPVLRQFAPYPGVELLDSFYRAGSLVFGGGHVVLPLLEREVVSVGWVSKEMFLAGYGAAQAVPGPLFTFASYLGAVIGGWPIALLTTVAVFLPSFLLVIGILPFWQIFRSNPKVQGSLMGVNAAVVGLLLAALYDPIWTSSIHRPVDFTLAAVLYCQLEYWKLPSWVVVLTGVAGGSLIFISGL